MRKDNDRAGSQGKRQKIVGADNLEGPPHSSHSAAPRDDGNRFVCSVHGMIQTLYGRSVEKAGGFDTVNKPKIDNQSERERERKKNL